MTNAESTPAQDSDREPGTPGLYEWVVPGFAQALENLAGQLDKAETWLAESGGSLDALLTTRLAPDMFPLSSQIAFACVQASECVARLTGQPPPSPPAANTGALARAAIELARGRLRDCDRRAIDAAAARPVEIRLPGDLTFDLNGHQYIRDWAIPQFYFHLVAAYAIMRAQGVPLGKADYVPHMFAYLRPTG